MRKPARPSNTSYDKVCSTINDNKHKNYYITYKKSQTVIKPSYFLKISSNSIQVKNTNNNNSTPIITFFNEVANKLIENIHFNEKLNSHLNSINLTENDNTLILNNPEKQNIQTITNDNRYANPDFIIHNQNETLETIQISFTSDFRKKRS